MRIDVHQHLWTEPLVSALSRRSRAPYVRGVPGAWTLHTGEGAFALSPTETAIDHRVQMLADDGIDQAIVCLSSPVGIEALPREEAEELIAAYEQGVYDLPAQFRAWGAIPLDRPDPDDVDGVIDTGFVGLSLPADALASPSRVVSLMPVLRRLARRGMPLLVHPGPAPAQPWAAGDPRAPEWWGALTCYVSGMHAAWLAFLAEGRRALPSLRVLFAMLGGCAPLHHERLVARGGPGATVDPLTFYDTSSYGPQALDAMVRCVGIEQLVYGTDRPVVVPGACPLGDAARDATFGANPLRLLGQRELAVAAA